MKEVDRGVITPDASVGGPQRRLGVTGLVSYLVSLNKEQNGSCQILR